MKNDEKLFVLAGLNEAHLEHLPELRKLLNESLGFLGLASSEGRLAEFEEADIVISKLAASLHFIDEVERIAAAGAKQLASRSESVANLREAS